MKWILKRIARSLFTIFAVVNLSFVLIYFLPGGPLAYLRAQIPPGQPLNADTYLNMDPDQPLEEQYVDYMSSLARGDMGQSLHPDFLGTPVSEILAEAVPWTVFLMFNALALSFGIGLTLGATMAYFEGTKFDNVATVVSITLNSIPYYVIAILFAFVLGHQLELFPPAGRYDGSTTPGVNWAFISSALHHAALPVFSWVLYGFGGWALAMRGNSIRLLGEDFIRVGRLRGLPRHRLAINYVGRNAILPLYTSMLIAVGYAFGGAIVLEVIFGYRGMGYYLYRAVLASDYPLLMGGFILIVVAVISALFMAELTYGKLDPRAREGGNNETY